jgi:hypothetical protein
MSADFAHSHTQQRAELSNLIGEVTYTDPAVALPGHARFSRLQMAAPRL